MIFVQHRLAIQYWGTTYHILLVDQFLVILLTIQTFLYRIGRYQCFIIILFFIRLYLFLLTEHNHFKE